MAAGLCPAPALTNQHAAVAPTQGDSPNTGHIVAALHCHIGALVLREALVPLGFAQAAASSGQSDLVNAASGLLVGPDGVAADDSGDAMQASAATGALEGAGSGSGDVLASAFLGANDVAVGSGGRLTPDAASALWWTWWPADLPVASVSFEDTTSLLGCAHVDLRPLIAALVGEPVRPRAASLNLGQDVPIPERLRRGGWRPPRRFIRIRRDLQEPGAPVLRVDEPAPLPSTARVVGAAGKQSVGQGVGQVVGEGRERGVGQGVGQDAEQGGERALFGRLRPQLSRLPFPNALCMSSSRVHSQFRRKATSYGCSSLV